jgi:SAM-dependent methyltransferase
VLDAGCGTGENALFLAERGHVVLGIDFAASAVAQATRKAEARGLGRLASFLVRDALQPGDLGRTFDTVLDVGLFHTLQPADRVAYAAAMRALTTPGGRCLVLAWSDRNPFGYGPERVRRRDLRAAFSAAWRVESVDAEELETLLPEGHVHAWLARMSPR